MLVATLLYERWSIGLIHRDVVQSDTGSHNPMSRRSKIEYALQKIRLSLVNYHDDNCEGSQGLNKMSRNGSEVKPSLQQLRIEIISYPHSLSARTITVFTNSAICHVAHDRSTTVFN